MSPTKKKYSSYWLSIVERLAAADDLKDLDAEVGYYSALSHLVEASPLSQADFGELYTNLEKQSMAPAIALFQKVAKDIELEDDELAVKREAALAEPYKYMNADAHINPFVKSALNKTKVALNLISKIVDNEAFKDTVAETVALYGEYPL